MLPPAQSITQPAAFFPNPLGDAKATTSAQDHPNQSAQAHRPSAASQTDAQEDTGAAHKFKEAYIRLKRKGLSVDVDTMLFPEDRDLYFTVSVPPIPIATPTYAVDEASGRRQGGDRSTGGGNSNTTGQFETSSQLQAKTDNTSKQHIQSQSENVTRLQTQTDSQAQGKYESDARGKLDTTSRIEIKTENVPYPQPTPMVVFVTPPPTPAPPPGTVQKLFVSAQKMTYARRFDTALRDIEKAIDIEPGNAVLHALHGSIYYKMGDYDAARNSWYKALQLDPTMYDVRERLNLISSKPTRGVQ